ncbi:hypothetical protein AYI70_g10040 [Smittium culicis]|uniref:Uncharacterized protein n=1 Tax=Smittium culicis TaxID=133412 RepID=A0A1R1X8E6_9FUNG|nr:hypothetical protein AYI70_g10040 [Smittium culicis]
MSTYQEPTRKILEFSDMNRWDNSQAKHELLSFIRQLNESVMGKKVPVEDKSSTASIDQGRGMATRAFEYGFHGLKSVSNGFVWEQGADRLRQRPRAMLYGPAARAVESGHVQRGASGESGALGFQQVPAAGAQNPDGVPAGTRRQPRREFRAAEDVCSRGSQQVPGGAAFEVWHAFLVRTL